MGRVTTPRVNLVCCRTMRFNGARVITHDGIVDSRGCSAVGDGRGDGGYRADGAGPFLSGVSGRFVDPSPLPFAFAFGFSFLALAFAFVPLRAFGLEVGDAGYPGGVLCTQYPSTGYSTHFRICAK